MMYLISQLSLFLVLAALAAAAMGWAVAAHRAAPAERALRRERENLVRDILRLASGDAGQANAIEAERQTDVMRRQLEMRDGRVTELERALEAARGRNDELAGELADLQRRFDQQRVDADELERLRIAQEAERVVEPVVVAPGAGDDDAALQAWRLRYFEQRVKYLEAKAKEAPAPVAPAPVVEAASPVAEWRARDAEARATYLADAMRALTGGDEPAAEAAAEADVAPFASNADVDTLLRWRMLYLERRVAHLQAQAETAAQIAPAPTPEPEPEPVVEAAPDPDRWKWRARYLEARVRHLEQRPPVVIQQVAAPEPSEPTVAVAEAPRTRAVKPAILPAARNGAPDDFTLIDGVSLLQQTTLYSLGVFHFDQIGAWTPENVAWVDAYLRLRGRIDEEEWVEQAQELARDGPAAARRAFETEDA
ncbi:MAG: hypothetical protein AB7O98_06795 [Hyphomonadaceae bacterium]